MHVTMLTLVFLVAVSVAAFGASNKETTIPYTSFQTPTGYRADNDIRTDAVIVYSDAADRITSWKDNGYHVQTMYGFRTRDDYIKNHPDEVQARSDGTMHTCGPGSYYMVPTSSRIDAAVKFFTNAINNGTSAVIPEEPEFFSTTGYSQSFKTAWEEHYNEPWQDQESSVEARYKSEQLKAKLQCDMIKAILDSAERQDSDVRRMLAFHSPVNYASWGIISPHHQLISIPSLQEVIGQVWTGTARTACKYAGVAAERTFENAFLEYSSLDNLMRGTGKRLWFLMDPLEDNPDRTMADYHTNYEKTVVASLMFPAVDAYEVMPWPTRIYGRVDDEFAIQIGSIINALGDMHNQKTALFDTGTRGMGTFVADSMAWQRGAPDPSSFDSFYGITLPLIMKGIPIQVAQLERTPEKDYLKPYKVLFVSHDILKPMKPAYNQALADWVKQGGVLVYFGGTDAYNAAPEWWTQKGYGSPQADLYLRLGVSAPLRSVVRDASGGKGTTVLRDVSSGLTNAYASFEVPPEFPLTLCGVEKGGLYHAEGESGSVVFEHEVGKGALIHAGISPAYFASSPEAADMLRAIAGWACSKAGVAYEEQQRIGIRRGKYVAMRTFDGKKELKGRYVDLFDPKLPVIQDPAIGEQAVALYCDVTAEFSGAPKLLYSSSKVEDKHETTDAVTLHVSGPLKTKGVARVYTAGRSPKSVAPEDVRVEEGADTILLTYDNKPESVRIEINWR